MEDIKLISQSIKDWLVSVRRDLHQTPELGMCEFKTKEKIIKYLNEIGIDYIESKYNTAILAYINNNSKTTIGLRADIDALPIKEELDSDFKSIYDGKMHACGHDAHTAILLGTCKLLYSLRNSLDANVKFFFQPAEETIGGAKPMIDEGFMDNPYVNYMLGLHVMPHIDTGCVELKYDTLNASTDTINITIKGTKSHGAYPQNGIDAVVVASHVITALQTIVSRNIDPTDSVVISIGMINGGFQGNIICDEVKLTGSLRTLHPTVRTFAKSRIKEIVDFTTKSFSASAIVSIDEGYSPLINNNEIVDFIKENVSDLLGVDKLIMRKQPSLGAEDFSFFLEKCKGAFYHLGCRNTVKGITSPLHTSTFDIDEDCLPIGVMLHVSNVFKLSNL